MASRASVEVSGSELKSEIQFSNNEVSLCLLLQRRARTMRVIDFRAGVTPRKRATVLKLAREQGVEKVYTLVERDEVSTWTKLGFVKEANIPCFYKRSDAYLLGCSTDAPLESGTRIAAARPMVANGATPPSLAGMNEPEDDEDDEPEDAATLAAQARAEKTIVQARKHAKNATDVAMPKITLAQAKEPVAKKTVDKLAKAGLALTTFESFGRDAIRRYFTLAARGNFELLASVETQPCFGNAFLELLRAPKGDTERLHYVGAVRAMCTQLTDEGVVSCFALTPSDDIELAAAYVANGFRRTGVLQKHLLVGRTRKDAILWSRKLANPAVD